MTPQKVKQLTKEGVYVCESLSHVQLFVTPWMFLCPWDSPSEITGLGCHSLVRRTFPTQGLALGLQRCRQILYHLSHHIQMKNIHIKKFKIISYSVQFSSVTQLCPTLCDPMNPSTPGLPFHHQLPEFTQTHVHRICDAI